MPRIHCCRCIMLRGPKRDSPVAVLEGSRLLVVDPTCPSHGLEEVDRPWPAREELSVLAACLLGLALSSW